MAEPLVIDVALDAAAGAEDELIVLVEPLYGVPAVALALDAGWGSVELAGEQPDAAPIPLVSFEQPPPAAQRGGRCRVRCDDIAAAVQPALGGAAPVLLGAPSLARPLCARIAASPPRRIIFVAVRSAATAPDPAAGAGLAADSWWASGMLIRILLEELDAEASTLTDAAGISVTLAQGAEDPAAQLGTGLRWRRHLARGGHGDDLRVAAAVDTVGVVPRVRREGPAMVATPW